MDTNKHEYLFAPQAVQRLLTTETLRTLRGKKNLSGLSVSVVNFFMPAAQFKEKYSCLFVFIRGQNFLRIRYA